jgi:hypothetical protein
MVYQRVLSISILGLAACGNVSGNVASTKTGDTSRPAERRSPVDDLRAACGDGAPTAYGTTAVRRQPYLQQVTTSSAMLGWVTTQPAGAHVTVTTPPGTVLATTPANVEDYALRTASETQMWSAVKTLEPNTIYCYEVADDAQPMIGRTGFRTAPAADSTEPVRFLAFGDSGGGGSDQFALLDQMYTVPRRRATTTTAPCKARRSATCSICPATRSGTRTIGDAFISSRSTPSRTTRRR